MVDLTGKKIGQSLQTNSRFPRLFSSTNKMLWQKGQKATILNVVKSVKFSMDT